jgi:hypothetical protein
LREVGEGELAAVDVHAAELGTTVQLGKNFSRIQDLGRVEGAFDALLLVQVVLVEHHQNQVALSTPTPYLPAAA